MKAPESQEMPVRGGAVWPVSVEAYHVLSEAGVMPGRTELLYGFVYHKMSKSPFHSLLLVRLLRMLQAVLGEGVHLRPEQPLTCGGSEPEPDLAVVVGSAEDYGSAHPRTAELVIEICVTSHEYDRSKLRAYALAGVKECWMVLGPEKQMEVYRQPREDRFAERTLQGPGGRFSSLSLPGVTVDLEELFRV